MWGLRLHQWTMPHLQVLISFDGKEVSLPFLLAPASVRRPSHHNQMHTWACIHLNYVNIIKSKNCYYNFGDKS